MPNRTYLSEDEIVPARTRAEREALRREVRAQARGAVRSPHFMLAAKIASVVFLVIAASLLANAASGGRLLQSLMGPFGGSNRATGPGGLIISGADATATTTTTTVATTSTTTGTSKGSSTGSGTTDTSGTGSGSTGGSTGGDTGGSTGGDTGGSTGGDTGGGTGGGDSGNAPASDPVTRSATDSFSVANVAPEAGINTDFGGGERGATSAFDVVALDRNTLAGAQIVVCIHRVGVSCATTAANGSQLVRWTMTMTSAAPTITPDTGNGDWAVTLRSRTGSDATTTATYGLDVQIGSQADTGDWVAETTTVDELGLSATAVGQPAAVSAPSESGSSGIAEFFSNLWPF